MKIKGRTKMAREKRFIKLNSVIYYTQDKSSELAELVTEICINVDHLIFFEKFCSEKRTRHQNHIPKSAKTIIYMNGGSVIYTTILSSHLSFILGTRELRE
jgi:hypothetical protein